MKKLYGIPVQVENIGLLVNTKLAEGADDLRAARDGGARVAKKKNHLAFGICVQQGSGGDAYHMYPFFSGLGGYVFGVNKAGNLDPSDIGVANPAFLKNAKLIDKWNKEGLINSKTDYATLRHRVPRRGRPPFWITGPWAVGDDQEGRREVPRRPGAGDRQGLGAVPGRQRHDGDEVRRDARRRRRRRTTWS